MSQETKNHGPDGVCYLARLTPLLFFCGLTSHHHNVANGMIKMHCITTIGITRLASKLDIFIAVSIGYKKKAAALVIDAVKHEKPIKALYDAMFL